MTRTTTAFLLYFIQVADIVIVLVYYFLQYCYCGFCSMASGVIVIFDMNSRHILEMVSASQYVIFLLNSVPFCRNIYIYIYIRH